MKNLGVLLKKELRSFFFSPVAYTVIVTFIVIAGFFFYTGMSFYAITSVEMSRMARVQGPQELSLAQFVLQPFFGNLSVIMLLMTPLLTMRLLSEERKTGSVELLYTWPLRDSDIVLAKYFSALIVFAVMLSFTFTYTGFIWLYSPPPWKTIFTGYLGLLLLGAAFLALGMFVSSLTENQIISAAGGFGALLVFWVIAWVAGDKTGGIYDILNYISALKHFTPFTKGLLDTRDIIYYISFIFFFLFLTFRTLESRKWRGLK